MKSNDWVVLTLACLAWSLAIGTAAGVELSAIERTIARAPEFESSTPRYCLLALGPDAETRVWLVLDGKVLYVDRNGDGDLTGEDERLEPVRRGGLLASLLGLGSNSFRLGTIRDSRGGTYSNITVEASTDERWLLSAECEGRGQQMVWPKWGASPEKAPIIHLGGPLTLQVAREQVGPKRHELYVEIGSPGLGENTFAFLLYHDVPKGVHPVALLEFSAPDGSSEIVTAELSERC